MGQPQKNYSKDNYSPAAMLHRELLQAPWQDLWAKSAAGSRPAFLTGYSLVPPSDCFPVLLTGSRHSFLPAARLLAFLTGLHSAPLIGLLQSFLSRSLPALAPCLWLLLPETPIPPSSLPVPSSNHIPDGFQYPEVLLPLLLHKSTVERFPAAPYPPNCQDIHLPAMQTQTPAYVFSMP